MTGTRYALEVQSTLPESLGRLNDLANDLLYSWDHKVRNLFSRLDRHLWDACHHNPKLFVRRIAQAKLLAAADDRNFMEDYRRVLFAYDIYCEQRPPAEIEQYLHPKQDLIAYFCPEFGFHESFPIYSGGLGILAADHCKTATDLSMPFVAVGLLYQRGYFDQTIDANGKQIAHYSPISFSDLPLSPARQADRKEVRIELELPGRTILLKVWQAKAGNISLYLLDSDLPENNEQDRSITYRLYDDDRDIRIQQEIILGLGGIRALRAMGLNPNIWHINEGHAAFLTLERCRELVVAGIDFSAALEQAAAATVFTNHTSVATGHEVFDKDLVSQYFAGFIDQLGIDQDRFLALGQSPDNKDGFNMTALALRISRFRNGVSRINSGVVKNKENYIWPQIPAEENPISYVTNGVHIPTVLAREWVNLFDARFREWRNKLSDKEYWQCIDTIPDHRFWSLHQSLKTDMLEHVRGCLTRQYQRNGYGVVQLESITKQCSHPEQDILILGFAQRFANYKRPALLFSDLDRLAKLLNNPDRPALLICAGKADPNDQTSLKLIETIHEYAHKPELLGKILLVEGYDMALARKLVCGVDVWLNTPEYPMEASGTSGQKAGINGVLNLSLLDGWWGEGYNGENGWAIQPRRIDCEQSYRDREEAKDLLNILEKQVIPLYYDRINHGYSPNWVAMAKESMKSLIPRYNSQRMLKDYLINFYAPAKRQSTILRSEEYAGAKSLAKWKRKILEKWPGVKLERVDSAPPAINFGETLKITVSVSLNGLEPHDVILECLVGRETENQSFEVKNRHLLSPEGESTQENQLFSIELKPELSGLQYYKLRIYPYHKLASHPFETGCMLWL